MRSGATPLTLSSTTVDAPSAMDIARFRELGVLVSMQSPRGAPEPDGVETCSIVPPRAAPDVEIS